MWWVLDNVVDNGVPHLVTLRHQGLVGGLWFDNAMSSLA